MNDVTQMLIAKVMEFQEKIARLETLIEVQREETTKSFAEFNNRDKDIYDLIRQLKEESGRLRGHQESSAHGISVNVNQSQEVRQEVNPNAVPQLKELDFSKELSRVNDSSIKGKIASGDLIGAIESLRTLDKENDFDIDLTVLESRYARTISDIDSGIIDRESSQLELNQIVRAIASTFERIQEF